MVSLKIKSTGFKNIDITYYWEFKKINQIYNLIFYLILMFNNYLLKWIMGDMLVIFKYLSFQRNKFYLVCFSININFSLIE